MARRAVVPSFIRGRLSSHWPHDVGSPSPKIALRPDGLRFLARSVLAGAAQWRPAPSCQIQGRIAGNLRTRPRRIFLMSFGLDRSGRPPIQWTAHQRFATDGAARRHIIRRRLSRSPMPLIRPPSSSSPTLGPRGVKPRKASTVRDRLKGLGSWIAALRTRAACAPMPGAVASSRQLRSACATAASPSARRPESART